MSHEDEIRLQKEDDLAYQRWLMSRPEYWTRLTDELTAKVVSSNGANYASAYGECGE